MKAKVFKIGLTLIFLAAIILVYIVQTNGNEKESVTGTNNHATDVREVSNQEAIKVEVEEKELEENKEENTVETTPFKEELPPQLDFLVMVDPGHQQHANLEKEPVGPGATVEKIKVSGGTTGVATGKPEYQLTLEASLILGELLEKRGIKVMFTRTSHNVNLSNKERAEMANKNQADLFIRIHADGSNNRKVRGLSVLTPAANDPYTKPIFEDSLVASQLILDQTKKNPAVKVNGLTYRDDLSGFNWSQVPCTLVEMGFMSNPLEDRNLSDTTYLTELLTNIADGIVQYAEERSGE